MATLDKIKLSGTTYDIVDSTAIHSMDGYWDSGTTQNAITAATNALAESIAEQGYQTSGDVQNAISGKVDTSTYTAYTAATDSTLSNKADKSEIPSVSGYADSVMYNSTSKYVEFYHGTTAGTKVYEFDASPFIIDGMVQNVEIKDVTSGASTVTCLVVSFNTDAGKQDINIPISEIFDASNYYTKSEADAKISQEVSGKADASDVQTISGNVNTISGDVATISGDVATLSGTVATKQDQLVSGTNIKTVNNNSLLGSGNIDITAGFNVEVTGTTLIFS